MKPCPPAALDPSKTLSQTCTEQDPSQAGKSSTRLGIFSMTTTPHADAAALPLRTVTIGWALKRALMGICILFIVVWGAAWLLYASIDPSLEAATAAPMTTGSIPH